MTEKELEIAVNEHEMQQILEDKIIVYSSGRAADVSDKLNWQK